MPITSFLNNVLIHFQLDIIDACVNYIESLQSQLKAYDPVRFQNFDASTTVRITATTTTNSNTRLEELIRDARKESEESSKRPREKQIQDCHRIR